MPKLYRKVTYLSPKLDKKITEKAKRQSVSTSSVIKQIIKEHFED